MAVVGSAKIATKLNNTNKVLDKIGLNRKLASEQQLAELNSGSAQRIAGEGTHTKLRDAPRLSSEYGGAPEDWAKIRSSNKKHIDGFNQETHAYQNIKTNKIVEHKTKLEGH